MFSSPWIWISFNAFVVLMLALDYFMHRKPEEVKTREAVKMSAFWISLALIFNFMIYKVGGKTAGLEFLAGYLVELSLSVDNLFVFILIFKYFRTPAIHQRKILFWGIVGAQIMRAIFILSGVALLQRFHWIIYIFGAFLIFSGWKIFTGKETEDVHPDQNPVVKLVCRFVPMVKGDHGGAFVVKQDNKWGWAATPLLLVLIAIETTDLVFALDSIPAILAITKEPFIVYSSNIFAILGLRAMYFALAGLMKLFHFLHYGLGIILCFVGVKMLGEHYFHVPIVYALGFIVVTLGLSVLASYVFPQKKMVPEKQGDSCGV